MPDHRAAAARPSRQNEDYLTARGANPMTGLISPSVYSPATPSPSIGGYAANSSSDSDQNGVRSALPLGELNPMQPRERLLSKVHRLKSKLCDEISDASCPPASKQSDTRGTGQACSPRNQDKVSQSRQVSHGQARPPLRPSGPQIGQSSIRTSPRSDDVLLGFNVPTPSKSQRTWLRSLNNSPGSSKSTTVVRTTQRSTPPPCEQASPQIIVTDNTHARSASLPVTAPFSHVREGTVHHTPVANEGHSIRRKPVSQVMPLSTQDDPVNERWPNAPVRMHLPTRNLSDQLPNINLRHPNDAATPRGGFRSPKVDPPLLGSVTGTAAAQSPNTSKLGSEHNQIWRVLCQLKVIIGFVVQQLQHTPPIQRLIRHWRVFASDSASPEERLQSIKGLCSSFAAIWGFCLALLVAWSTLTILKSTLDVLLQPFWYFVRFVLWLKR